MITMQVPSSLRAPLSTTVTRTATRSIRVHHSDRSLTRTFAIATPLKDASLTKFPKAAFGFDLIREEFVPEYDSMVGIYRHVPVTFCTVHHLWCIFQLHVTLSYCTDATANARGFSGCRILWFV